MIGPGPGSAALAFATTSVREEELSYAVLNSSNTRLDSVKKDYGRFCTSWIDKDLLKFRTI